LILLGHPEGITISDANKRKPKQRNTNPVVHLESEDLSDQESPKPRKRGKLSATNADSQIAFQACTFPDITIPIRSV
jgi:hypothetical protein